MKTRDILNTVTRILPDWHVYNDHQFGRITAFDPQAGYEVTVNLPDSDTIRIVRTRYELVEDNTVLDTADMGEEQTWTNWPACWPRPCRAPTVSCG